MEAGSAWFAQEPARRRESALRVGRSIACRQAQLDGLAWGIEAHEVHAGCSARADHRDLQLVALARPLAARIGEARFRRMGCENPAREVPCRPGWAVGLRAAVPLDQVGVEGIDGAEQLHRTIDRPAEATVTEDDRVHVVLLAEGRRVEARLPANQKATVTDRCPRPLEPPFPGGPLRSTARALRAPGPVPPGRAARASSCSRR